jgi:thiol:disulfide interchange protein DsbC
MLMMRNTLISLLAVMAMSPAVATEVIEKRMAEVVPTVSPDSIQPTEMAGIFEVRYGTDIFYVSEDGRFLLQGNLIDLESRQNLTEQTRRGVRAEIFAEIPDAELTVYTPEGGVRHTLNVFTDPNCPYCRQMHGDMEKYLEAGIKVRYFMYPVLGRQSPEIMRDVWCADSRTDAMDRAKAGLAVASRDCPTPAEEHLALGREMGISGTPASITSSGQLISGFRPVVEVLMMLESE